MFVQDWKVQQLHRFGACGVSPDIRKMQLQRITEAVEQQPRELTRELKAKLRVNHLLQCIGHL